MSDVLIDRARTRGASRMIAQGTDSKDVTPDQCKQVAADLEVFCKTYDLTRKAVAKAVGYSPGVISEFIKGTYAGNAGQVAIDLDDWLVEEEQRRARQDQPEFVWTNVARYIDGVARYCLDYRKVGLIYGPETSGLGKTTSLEAIHRELGPRRSGLMTIKKGDASSTSLLCLICGALGIDQGRSISQKMDRIIEALKNRSYILLIDQIHNLRFANEDKPYYHLMDIFDATKTAQLWCGTADMVEYLKRQRAKTHDEPLAQIRRRIFPCVDLVESLGGGDGGEPLFTVDQVRNIYRRQSLKLTNAGVRWLCALARFPDSGGLGIVNNVVECATMFAKQRSISSIDIPLLKEGLRWSVTDKRYNELSRGADSLMETEKLKVA